MVVTTYSPPIISNMHRTAKTAYFPVVKCLTALPNGAFPT
jgi:hypothetical protein